MTLSWTEALSVIFCGAAATFCFLALRSHLHLVRQYRDALNKNRRLLREVNTWLEQHRAESLRPPSRREMDQLSVEMVELMLLNGLSEEDAKRTVLEKFRRVQFDLEDH